MANGDWSPKVPPVCMKLEQNTFQGEILFLENFTKNKYLCTYILLLIFNPFYTHNSKKNSNLNFPLRTPKFIGFGEWRGKMYIILFTLMRIHEGLKEVLLWKYPE